MQIFFFTHVNSFNMGNITEKVKEISLEFEDKNDDFVKEFSETIDRLSKLQRPEKSTYTLPQVDTIGKFIQFNMSK